VCGARTLLDAMLRRRRLWDRRLGMGLQLDQRNASGHPAVNQSIKQTKRNNGGGGWYHLDQLLRLLPFFLSFVGVLFDPNLILSGF